MRFNILLLAILATTLPAVVLSNGATHTYNRVQIEVYCTGSATMTTTTTSGASDQFVRGRCDLLGGTNFFCHLDVNSMVTGSSVVAQILEDNNPDITLTVDDITTNSYMVTDPGSQSISVGDSVSPQTATCTMLAIKHTTV